MRIPNYEVQREFERTIEEDNWEYVANTLRDSEQLLEDTLAGKAEAVKSAIDAAHQENTSILKYNDENSLTCVLSLAYVAARKDFMMVREFPSGKGFADIVLVPRRNVDKPAVVIELKKNQSAESGLAQIKRKQYADSLKEYVGDVVLVGISYDEKSKEHRCVIERIGTMHQTGHQTGHQTMHQTGHENVFVNRLVLAIGTSTYKSVELMAMVGLKNRDNFQSNYLTPALADEYVTYLYPENPKRRGQAYYLTPKGLKKLEELEAK